MASAVSSDSNRDDLESVQRQIHKRKADILESVRRMHGMIDESEAIGTNTAAELVEQREKLENIEKRLNGIDANLIGAQKNLNKLGSIFGGIKNYLRPPKSAFHKSASEPQLSGAAKKKTTSTTSRPPSPNDDPDIYLGKLCSQMDDVEREIEDEFRSLHKGVINLKNLALEMQQELDRQKPLIDRLDKKTGAINNDVSKKNKQMKKIS